MEGLFMYLIAAVTFTSLLAVRFLNTGYFLPELLDNYRANMFSAPSVHYMLSILFIGISLLVAALERIIAGTGERGEGTFSDGSVLEAQSEDIDKEDQGSASEAVRRLSAVR